MAWQIIPSTRTGTRTTAWRLHFLADRSGSLAWFLHYFLLFISSQLCVSARNMRLYTRPIAMCVVGQDSRRPCAMRIRRPLCPAKSLLSSTSRRANKLLRCGRQLKSQTCRRLISLHIDVDQCHWFETRGCLETVVQVPERNLKECCTASGFQPH